MAITIVGNPDAVVGGDDTHADVKAGVHEKDLRSSCNAPGDTGDLFKTFPQKREHFGAHPNSAFPASHTSKPN